VQRLVDAFSILAVTPIDLAQLALVPHQQLLSLGLSLLNVIISIFLNLLKQSIDCGFLLLLEAFQSKLNCLLIGQLLLPQLSGFGFLDLLLDRSCLFIFLQLH
jgi:hypothetical protein